MSLNEADTCRLFVTPKLRLPGWDSLPHSLNEQKVFTDGASSPQVVLSLKGPQKRADYLLRYTRDFSIAVVEAKPEDAPAGTGLQQAKGTPRFWALKFAYAANGHGSLSSTTSPELKAFLSAYPTPPELWSETSSGSRADRRKGQQLLTPSLLTDSIAPRYYQEIAINRACRPSWLGNSVFCSLWRLGREDRCSVPDLLEAVETARWNRAEKNIASRECCFSPRSATFLSTIPKDKTFATVRRCAVQD